ncbi:unnamed protein product [Ostreobium quekettii]|uniref:Uncharacterized protein n=1 Tax=Ostreobium quekettii TaxID=121088 RepID=A0A8S1IPI0_9CHLO|nr:unnamed protein product [Ostreobium quekettii]
MRCLQAVWPSTPIGHRLTALEAVGEAAAWTGAADGAIIKWSVEEAGGRASGAVLMCGHRAGVRTLQHCSDGLEDVDVVLSVDNDGVCCVWDCMTCVCLVQRSVPEFAGGAVRHVHPMGDGKVLVALDTSKQVVDGILSPHRGHTLAVLTLVSLEVVDSWKPSLRVPLFKGSLPADSGFRKGSRHILALKGYTADGCSFDGINPVCNVVGISSDLEVLLFTPKDKEGITQAKLPCACDADTPNSILGGVLSATYSKDGNHLLLVSVSGWALLTMTTWPHNSSRVLFVLSGAETVNALGVPLSPAARPRLRSTKHVSFIEPSDERSTLAPIMPNDQLSNRPTKQRPACPIVPTLPLPLGPLCGGMAVGEPETRLGGDNYPCSTGHVEEDTNNHLLQQPKVLLWDQDGAAAVLAADDLGGWHYTRQVPASVCPSGASTCHQTPQFSSGCHSSFVRAVSCCERDSCIQDVQSDSPEDTAEECVYDVDMRMFSMASCSQSQEEQMTPLLPVAGSRLSDLWARLDSTHQPSTRQDDCESADHGGQLVGTEGGQTHNTAAQSGTPPVHALSALAGACASARGQRKSVTCMALVGGICGLPYLLVQGLSGGEVSFCSLAAYGIPKPLCHAGSVGLPRLGMPVLATAAGHFGPVTCLFEVVYFGPHNAADMTLENGIVEGKGGLPLLVSGGADGSVRFWSLDKTSLGSKVFAVHAHSGAVRQVVGAAAGANAPWCQCLATVGDDGTVALISLLTRQVVRLLSGHPFQLPNQLMWDGIRGFIACLGTNSEGQQVLVIWDLYSGQRDRVFVGSQAKKMLECFAANVEDMAMTRQEHDWLQFQEGGCARVALAEHAPQDQLIKLLPGPKRDIGILDIDVTGILESPSGVSPAAWASGTVESWRRTVTVELLATALLCMHAWGVDRHVDDSLCALLGEMGLNQEGLKNGDLSTDPLATILGMSLTQGVMVSDTGAMTIQMPPTLACAVRRTKETAVNRGQDLSAAGIPVRAADLGHLWCNAAEFVGLQLLYAVALAKKLMHEGLNQVVATACSAIVKLYAIQFLDLAPAASVPSLGVLVGLWDTKNEILKDTARVLLASTTDPNRLMNSGEDGAPAQLTGRAEVDRVMTLWESCKSSGEWKDALAYAQEVVICGALCCVHSRLVPWPILQATAPLLAVLVCEPGHHYALMAASMLADALTGIEGPKWMNALGYTLPLIQSLLDVCDESHKKPKPSSHRLEKLGQSERPRSVRGDQPQEVGRMRRAKSESQLAPDEEGAATPHPTTPTPQLSSMPATTVPPSPFVTLQEFHSETGRTNETIPDDDASSSHSSKIEWASKPSHSLKITAKQIDGSARSQPRSPVSRSPRSRSPRSRSPLSRSPFSGETPNRKLRLHFQKASLSPFDFDGLAMEPWSPEELLYDVPVEEGLLPAYKEAVASVITALADLDLPLFLHCLGNRLVIDSMAGPQSLLTATGAISSVLRHRGGPKKAAPHLQLLTSVLMKALEPGQHSLRKSCYRGVTSLLAELCSLFPMLATNRAANRLALGNVVSTPLTPSRGKHKSDATRGLEAIAIYDLNTGHKKKCLSMGTALQQAAQHLKAAASGEEVTEDGTPGLGIAAVCFRQDGDVCAAYCPEATMLCVWDLRVSWGKKLSRGPTVIDPVKVVQLPPEVDVPRPGPGAQTDLAYRLSWQDANQVALHHGGRLLGVIELHLGS